MMQRLKTLIKQLIYRPPGVRMGPAALVRRPWIISNPSCVEIGARTLVGRRVTLNAMRGDAEQRLEGRIDIAEDVYIGQDSQVHAMRHLRIGAGCVLSDRVYVNDASHGMDPRRGLIMAQPVFSKGPIVLEEHVFIGVGSVVLPNVHLGHHCVVAAQSVVTRSQPPGTMVAGNPARAIKTLDFATGRWLAVASQSDAAAERGDHA